MHTDDVLRQTASEGPRIAVGQPFGFSNVLVGVDGGPGGRDAIRLAEILRDPRGQLMLAHVVITQSAVSRSLSSTTAWKACREMLARERDLVGVGAALTGTASSSVGRGLHQLADDWGADLLVVGSSRRGWVGRALRGDDARAALSGAPCAVAVAPAGYLDRPRPVEIIGLGYDGTNESKAATAAARTLAARYGASVRVGLRSEGLRTLGNEVNLLILGSCRRGALRRLLRASTSARLARSSCCAVLSLSRTDEHAQGRKPWS